MVRSDLSSGTKKLADGIQTAGFPKVRAVLEIKIEEKKE